MMTRVCTAVWPAASAGAASAARLVVAVTSDWRIDAAAARRIVVKETWSVPAGPGAGPGPRPNQ